MKFKLDEDVPRPAVELFRRRGHDVLMVLDQVHAGVSDPKLAALVSTEGRALVTLDLDFSDIRTYEPGQFPGIVIQPTPDGVGAGGGSGCAMKIRSVRGNNRKKSFEVRTYSKVYSFPYAGICSNFPAAHCRRST